LAYQIANVGRKELSTAPDEYSGFLMTLLRLHAFRPSSVADIVSTVTVRRKSIDPIAAVAPMVSLVQHATSSAVDQPLQLRPVSLNETNWRQIISSLQLTGLARTLAQHCELRHIEENECLLRLAPEHAHLQMKPAPDKLQQALRDYFVRPLVLRFELAQQDADTPAVTADREKRARQESAIASIEQDNFVRDVIDSFDGALIESSIKPIA
jgi:DNA polymerase-3 subunit gamma/tau